MKIAFITPADEQLASFRYRMRIPAEELRKLGHEVWVGMEAPIAVDVVVISKHFLGNWSVARQALRAGARLVFDMCDNYFPTDGKWEYRALCLLADKVTCSSKYLADEIRKYAKVEAIHIGDPYEMPECKAREPGKDTLLLCYGFAKAMDALNAELPNLAGFNLLAIGWSKQENIGIEITQWSPETMRSGMEACDIVIIPSAKDETACAKSCNRMVEGFRSGRFVVANDIPPYQEFRDWAFLGDIRQGVEWAIKNPAEARQRIEYAKTYIREYYAPRRIGELWQKALSA